MTVSSHLYNFRKSSHYRHTMEVARNGGRECQDGQLPKNDLPASGLLPSGVME